MANKYIDNVSSVIELMEKYNLTISVINKNKLWNINLQNYNQLRWPKQSKQQSSVISFIPMIFIFLIALITISIGSYWSGRVRYEIYQCSLPNILPINNGGGGRKSNRMFDKLNSTI